MSIHIGTVRDYWRTSQERDWDGFAALFAEDVVYQMPQTRERILGRERFVAFNRDYPGDPQIAVRRVVAADDAVTTLVDVTVADEVLTGISFFSFDQQGLIVMIEDYWPEPYQAPPGREHLVERF